MEMKRPLNNEVLMYTDKSLRFFNSNEEAREYFYIDVVGFQEFKDILLEVIQSNYEKSGIPDLTRDQYEEIREKMYYKVLELKRKMYDENFDINQFDSFFSKKYIEEKLFKTISLN